MMADLPGARQERFNAEETNVLVRAVKDREVALYGDGRNPFSVCRMFFQLQRVFLCVFD